MKKILWFIVLIIGIIHSGALASDQGRHNFIEFKTGNCTSILTGTSEIIQNLASKCIIKGHLNEFRPKADTTLYEFIKMIVNSIYYQSEKKVIEPKKSLVLNPTLTISNLNSQDPNSVFIIKAYEQGLLEGFIKKTRKGTLFEGDRPVTYEDMMRMITNLKNQGIQIYDKPFWKSNITISREQMAKNIVTLFAFDVSEFKGYLRPSIVMNISEEAIPERMFGAAPLQEKNIDIDSFLGIHALIPNLTKILKNVNS